MLDKEIFKKGVAKLEIEYKDRGFIMTREKAEQWYGYMKGYAEKEFNKRIDTCIKTCHHVPFMSDITDVKMEAENVHAPFDFAGL